MPDKLQNTRYFVLFEQLWHLLLVIHSLDVLIYLETFF